MFCIRFKSNSKTSIIVGVLYKPPNSDLDYANQMCNNIELLVNQNKSAVILLGGDLNLTDIDWDSYTIKGNQYSKAINERYIDMVHSCNHIQTVIEPIEMETH